ncbi:glutathione synthetase [Escherichia coli]|uniref:Glutathione synthetase n=1 Tax=Escherichia coli TaxID=562 RepID=A0A377DLZ6_ECOLX|nr:glutathione synthetase [Escherichia coli]
MIKLGIVMDPIANINIKKDSSFAMLLEAQRRGYETSLYGDGRSVSDQW